MLGKYTVLNLQIFELFINCILLYLLCEYLNYLTYICTGIVGKQDILFDPK